MPNRIWLDKLLDRLANSRAASCLRPTFPSAKCVDLTVSGEVPELDSGFASRARSDRHAQPENDSVLPRLVQTTGSAMGPEPGTGHS